MAGYAGDTVPSPMHSTLPVSSRFAFEADPRMCSSSMDEISAESAGAGTFVVSLFARILATAPFSDALNLPESKNEKSLEFCLHISVGLNTTCIL